MPRPKGPSPESVKRIYAVLVDGPKCFEDIWKETNLHRNTVASTLNKLVEKGLLQRYRKVHKKMYEVVKTQRPYIGWEIPWIALMMTKKDWQLEWKKVDEEIRRFQEQKKWNNFVWRYCDWLINHPNNQGLLKTLEEMGMLNVPMIKFRENLENPFCLECLRNDKKFVKTIFDRDAGEFVCPTCGVVAKE
jgi:predicted transcriptional regulator